MTASAWKTASGAAARVPVAQCTNLTRALAAYRKAGLFVVGLDADAETTIDEVDADLPLVLVVGAEGAGLSRLVRESCDVVAGIPIGGGHRVAQRQRRRRDRPLRARPAPLRLTRPTIPERVSVTGPIAAGQLRR